MPFVDEIELTVRFGAGAEFHGHDDGGAITLYGLGSRLLLDSGKAFHGTKPWTPFFTGRAAHNVVIVDGVHYERATTTEMDSALDRRSAFFVLRNAGYLGVEIQPDGAVFTVQNT